MIGDIVPAGVACAEFPGDDPDAALLPAERDAVTRAGPGRRAEFTTGRACARRALSVLGVPVVAIPADAGRAPVWPTGVVGSITHCRGYRAAAVAHADHLRSIGIDAEPHVPLPRRVSERVLLPVERDWLAVQRSGAHLDRLIFSAKESIYKAWHPVTHRWLGFRDAVVVPCARTGTFHATLRAPAPSGLREVRGRFLLQSGLILTATVVMHDHLA